MENDIVQLGKRINVLKNKSKKLIKELEFYRNKQKQISAKLYTGPHLNSYNNVISRMNLLNTNMDRLLHKINLKKHGMLSFGKGIVELAGLNPKRYNEYMEERREYLELKKQKKYIEAKMEIEKNMALSPINHKLKKLDFELEIVTREVGRLNFIVNKLKKQGLVR